MSALTATQNKLTSIAQKSPGKILDPDAALGINALPHNAQLQEQQKQNKNAEELKAQQAADAAAAAQGAQPMAVRDQLYNSASAGDVTASGNDLGTGEPLIGPRRRAARRVLVG
jgi:hypothetical protein